MTTLLDEVAEGISAWKCTSCEWFEEEEPDSPLYECGSCGERYNRDNSADGGSHRCPSCNKFGAKVADHACPECDEEVEEVTAYACPHCEDLLTEEDAGEEACPKCDAKFGAEDDEDEESESEDEAQPTSKSEPQTDMEKRLAEHTKLMPRVTGEPKPEDGRQYGVTDYFTWDLLKWAAEDAIIADRNRQMDLDYIERMDRSLKYPVVMSIPQGDASYMRVFIALDPDVNHPAVLDIDWATFWALPKHYNVRHETPA
jgi:uncharacterized Zn finger protein (UPF0148 family)